MQHDVRPEEGVKGCPHLVAANMRAAEHSNAGFQFSLSNKAVESPDKLVPYRATSAVPRAVCTPADIVSIHEQEHSYTKA